MDKHVREWLQYLKNIGCSVELVTTTEQLAKQLNVVKHRLLDLEPQSRPSSSVSIWNPTGDGTVIFVPDDLAEKALVLGELP